MAEVADSASDGFTVKLTMPIKATPDAVYDAFVHKVGNWWNSEHSFSHDAHNLTIDDKPMGCFCEKLPKGGVRHMQVIYASRGEGLILSGGMGPLLSQAVTGTLVVNFKAADGGTRVDVTYAVAGYMKGGMNVIAAPVDGVITDQIKRLKDYVEQGAK